MITRDGVVKVMDFGVAQTAARVDTEAGSVRGTLSYMAPEQVRGKPLDKRADVFSLGVILFELSTGTRLYRGSDVEIMTMIVERISVSLEEEGLQNTLRRIGSTLLAIYMTYAVIQARALQTFFLVFPESLIVILGVLVIVGRYTGYRLTEIARFRVFETRNGNTAP